MSADRVEIKAFWQGYRGAIEGFETQALSRRGKVPSWVKKVIAQMRQDADDLQRAFLRQLKAEELKAPNSTTFSEAGIGAVGRRDHDRSSPMAATQRTARQMSGMTSPLAFTPPANETEWMNHVTDYLQNATSQLELIGNYLPLGANFPRYSEINFGEGRDLCLKASVSISNTALWFTRVMQRRIQSAGGRPVGTGDAGSAAELPAGGRARQATSRGGRPAKNQGYVPTGLNKQVFDHIFGSNTEQLPKTEIIGHFEQQGKDRLQVGRALGTLKRMGALIERGVKNAETYSIPASARRAAQRAAA